MRPMPVKPKKPAGLKMSVRTYLSTAEKWRQRALAALTKGDISYYNKAMGTSNFYLSKADKRKSYDKAVNGYNRNVAKWKSEKLDKKMQAKKNKTFQKSKPKPVPGKAHKPNSSRPKYNEKCARQCSATRHGTYTKGRTPTKLEALGMLSIGLMFEGMFLFAEPLLVAPQARLITAPAKRTTGVTVLGRAPSYENLGENIGARYFKIPDKVWEPMSSAKKWASNKKFLDRTIARGDKIRLSSSINDARPGTMFKKELDYLFQKGFRPSQNGKYLVRM